MKQPQEAKQEKHREHIVCVPADRFANRASGFCDYTLTLGDLMLGQRKMLETTEAFRQILPVSVFMNKGRIWTYERTPAGGEAQLHNKVAVCVGGHWDMKDIVLEDGVINLAESFRNAYERELHEEILLIALIRETTMLPLMLCADDTPVDRRHAAVVFIHELNNEEIAPAEPDLRSLGFRTPEELLSGKYNLETWARKIAEYIAAKNV